MTDKTQAPFVAQKLIERTGEQQSLPFESVGINLGADDGNPLGPLVGLPSDWKEKLAFEIADCGAVGSVECSHSLGIKKMPDGYALMWADNCEQYFGVRWDGLESLQTWSKWAVYRWAVKDSQGPMPKPVRRPFPSVFPYGGYATQEDWDAATGK